LLALAAGIFAWGLFSTPLTQSQEYHRFADARMWLGIPNAADALSNLAFLSVGIAGLAFLRREWLAGVRAHFVTRIEIVLYGVFFAAVAATALGSAYYHLAPDDARLVWDRLPMAVAFMSFVAAVAAERVDPHVAYRLCVPLIVVGVASVAWWRLSALAGCENLRPYLAVQYGAMAMVFAMTVLFRSRYTWGASLFAVLAAYAASKLLELYDGEIFVLGSWFSGHTLKHLVAAAASFGILHSLSRRGRAGSSAVPAYNDAGGADHGIDHFPRPDRPAAGLSPLC